jgi:hypothetical protein
MIEFIQTLSGVYTLANLVMVYIMLEYIFTYYDIVGFRVKHLTLAILFLPSALLTAILFLLAILVAVITNADFWNKKLF